MKKNFLFGLLLFFTLSLFAEERPPRDFRSFRRIDRNVRLERPYSTKKIDEKEESRIYIKTNVYNAEVYLNGVYEGKSDLLIKNLHPGHYIVELYKDGYESDRFEVSVNPGYENTYKVELELIVGKIQLHDVPANSFVYVDGKLKSGNIIEATPGYHQLKVRKFGYSDFLERVYVEAYKYVDVNVEFSTADFEIYDFSASNLKINPDYGNKIGKTEFMFEVTANGSAELSIKNQQNEEIWFRKWTSFSTWNQSVTWNGKSDSGKELDDGMYTARLSSGDYWCDLVITIDHSMNYSLFSVNSRGEGIGSLPMVFKNSMNFIVPYFDFGVHFSDDKSIGFMNINLGLIVNFADHFEFNVEIEALPGGGTEKNEQMEIAASIKASNFVDLGNFCNFNYGGVLGWGISSEPTPIPYGIDNGNGLCAGLMAGLDFKNIYAGLSSNWILAAADGSSPKSGSVWKNGFALSWKCSYYINLNSWVALNSAFGCPYLGTENTTEWIRGINYGGEVLFMFGNSSWMGKARFEEDFILPSTQIFAVSFSLSYLL